MKTKTKKVTKRTMTKPTAFKTAAKMISAATKTAVRKTSGAIKSVTATKAATTTIAAKIDVGFGNNLFVRGQGAGLSWERGTPLTCVGGDTWQWQAKAGEKIAFKLLLNDAVWAQGDDVVVTPGKRVEVAPTF